MMTRGLGWAVHAEIREEKINNILAIAKNVIYLFFMLAVADILILLVSLSQMAIEGRTGYWAPFWSIQAKWLIRLLG